MFFNDEVDCNYVAVFKLTRKLYGFSELFNFGGKRSDKNLNSYVFLYCLPTDSKMGASYLKVARPHFFTRSSSYGRRRKKLLRQHL